MLRHCMELLGGLVLLVLVIAAPVAGQSLSANEPYTWHDNPFGISVTRWISPDGRVPMPYAQWRQHVGDPGPLRVDVVSSQNPVPVRGGTRFDILVNSSLLSQISDALDQYIADLAAEGYDITVLSLSGGTPQELRALLQSEYAKGLEGCVLIGDLPVAWGESECWDEKEHEEFPMDLFYMDLDGQFLDTDSDGIYDTHTGEVTPEIWLGRLTASPLTMDGATEVGLINSYFRKNHLYRTGRIPLRCRALVYIDDEWAGDSALWSSDASYAYSERTLVADRDTTWALDYKWRLNQGYDLIQVCSHSSPEVHTFTNSSGQWSYAYNTEIKSIDPEAHFYNLYACSNARFIESNYMGGWYVCGETYGLAAVGSTKTGAMLEFKDFYIPFGQGSTFGEAFRDWFTAQGEDGFEPWEVCWFYGMTLCGDPTLRKIPSVTPLHTLGPVPVTAYLNADIGLPITGCVWDLGDGQQATTPDVFHEYTQPGSYDVSVTMTTAAGAFAVTVQGLVSVYADTLTVDSVRATPGSRVGVHVNLRNYLALNQIVVPFHWTGALNLKLDSLAVTGLRTAQFTKSLADYNSSQKRATAILTCPIEQAPLAAGDGPVLTLWFTVPSSATPGTSPITLEPYLDYTARLYCEAGHYTPATGNGTVTYSLSCCVGPTVGNIDNSLDHLITMSDMTVLIDHLFISLAPVACVDAANVDLSPDKLITMSDLTVLIDHLFITLAPLPPCP